MRPYSYDDKTSFLKVCKLSTAHRKDVGTRDGSTFELRSTSWPVFQCTGSHRSRNSVNSQAPAKERKHAFFEELYEGYRAM